MAIPNYKAEVEKAKNKYPEAWSHAHVEGDPKRWDFIRLLAVDLYAKDPKVGLNGKRGNPNDLSMDALNYLCDAEDSDGRTPEGTPCAVIDVIASAGIPSQSPAWNPYTTKVEGSGAWVEPGTMPEPEHPVPPPVPTFPYPDEPTTVKAYQARVKATYNEAKRAFPDPNDEDAFRHFTRYGYSCHEMPEPEAANKHIAELRADLKLPPA